MGLIVIQGGLAEYHERDEIAVPSRAPTKKDVRQEAERRIAAMNYDRWWTRQQVTGVPMDRAIRIKYLEIGFVADALCSLRIIPDDYRLDIYWPR